MQDSNMFSQKLEDWNWEHNEMVSAFPGYAYTSSKPIVNHMQDLSAVCGCQCSTLVPRKRDGWETVDLGLGPIIVMVTSSYCLSAVG
jgi:hypothetical protein